MGIGKRLVTLLILLIIFGSACNSIKDIEHKKKLNEVYELIDNNSWDSAESHLNTIDNEYKDIQSILKYINAQQLVNNGEINKDDYQLAFEIFQELESKGDISDELTKYIGAFKLELDDISDALESEKEIVSEALTLVKKEKYARANDLLHNRFDFITEYKQVAHLLAFKSDFIILNRRYNRLDDEVGHSERIEKRRDHRLTMLEHMQYVDPNLEHEMITKEFIQELKEQLKNEYVDLNEEVWEQTYEGNKTKLHETKNQLAEIENENKLGQIPPQIGMTADEVRLSSWGSPTKINTTTNEYGVSEQWVYSLDKYVYLEDGVVVSIQE